MVLEQVVILRHHHLILQQHEEQHEIKKHQKIFVSRCSLGKGDSLCIYIFFLFLSVFFCSVTFLFFVCFCCCCLLFNYYYYHLAFLFVSLIQMFSFFSSFHFCVSEQQFIESKKNKTYISIMRKESLYRWIQWPCN